MDIDKIEAGPELDMLIDQKVFGREVLGMAYVCPEHVAFYRFYLPYDCFANPKHTDVVRRSVYLDQCACEFRDSYDVDYFGHTSFCLSVTREYSEVMYLAWEVVEELQKQGYGIGLSDYSDKTYCCSFYPSETTNEFKGDGEIMPLAICRAAYKALTTAQK